MHKNFSVLLLFSREKNPGVKKRCGQTDLRGSQGLFMRKEWFCVGHWNAVAPVGTARKCVTWESSFYENYFFKTSRHVQISLFFIPLHMHMYLLVFAFCMHILCTYINILVV